MDVKNECCIDVWVAMQPISVGDHFAVNCNFIFPGSGPLPCLLEWEIVTDDVISFILPWVTTGFQSTYWVWLCKTTALFVSATRTHFEKIKYLLFFQLGCVCILRLFLSFLYQCINVAFTLLLNQHLIVDQYSVHWCCCLKLLFKSKLCNSVNEC